jgi:hypothetical protein
VLDNIERVRKDFAVAVAVGKVQAGIGH